MIGRALAEPTRVAMLTALMTGTAWTVGELASWASVAPSTASEHVTHLAEAGLVTVHRQGRHSYVSLADERVASALESMSLIAPAQPVPASLRGHRHARELAQGRTCYHHLAGGLGVELADHMVVQGRVTRDYGLTEAGVQWFVGMGADPCRTKGSPPLRACMDWSERRPHLAGPLATWLTTHALENGWIQRGSHPRSVRLTPAGERYLLPPGEVSRAPAGQRGSQPGV